MHRRCLKGTASQEVTPKSKSYVRPFGFRSAIRNDAFFSYHQKADYGFARGATARRVRIAMRVDPFERAESCSSVSFALITRHYSPIGSFMILESSWARTIAMARDHAYKRGSERRRSCDHIRRCCLRFPNTVGVVPQDDFKNEPANFRPEILVESVLGLNHGQVVHAGNDAAVRTTKSFPPGLRTTVRWHPVIGANQESSANGRGRFFLR